MKRKLSWVCPVPSFIRVKLYVVRLGWARMVHTLSDTEVGDLLERCAILASLLEASGYPKPGNVHRTRDFGRTRYEHFLAGAVSIGPSLRELGRKAFRAGVGQLELSKIGLGPSILKASEDSSAWQNGGNVNIGIILLLAPLVAASGLYLSRGIPVELKKLRIDLAAVIQACDSKDSLAILRAIRSVVPPRVLGKAESLDLMDDSTQEAIRKDNLTPLRIFYACKDRDSICSEWTSDFSITFNLGYPSLRQALELSGDINTSTVHAFLQILSAIPDTLIDRKSGHTAALDVSRMAADVLQKGGLFSAEGKLKLLEMDRVLGDSQGNLNPGTTADITAASLYLLLFGGWRP